MKVLIVGAGAVGQAYGYHLQRGGAEVGFFIREKYRDELAGGVVVYPLNRKTAWEPEPFANYSLHSDWQTVSETQWDQVWLAVPSTAIRMGWLGDMMAAVGDATIVSLQPGLDDQDVLLAHVPAERLVQGVITLQSFHAPLPGDADVEPGIAWWFPPLSPLPLGGPAAAVTSVAAVLKKGGCPASPKPGKQVTAVGASALMMPIIGALETANWSFRTLRTTGALAMGCDAARQCAAIVAKAQNKRKPLIVGLIRPWLLGVVLRVAPRFTPFDLEKFLAYHFTKVGPQTRLMLDTYIDRGHAMKMPTDGVKRLKMGLSTPPA
ncbi:MAG: ketopantoate reductase [Myxococcales bacterium]|nr:ketopantoate reductase [Myxococcales bacterium]